jgi:hypothetical protein
MTEQDYATYRDRRVITLVHDEQYLIRTVIGGEVLASWDAVDKQWRQIAAGRNTPRGTVIEAGTVAAVATARSPGMKGSRSQWTPIDQCRHDPTPAKKKETIGGAILAMIHQHGPLTTAKLSELLPHIPPKSLRTACGDLANTLKLGRSYVMVGERQITAYTVGVVTHEPRKKTVKPHRADHVKAEPWIHPIRRRALGLPVAQSPLTVNPDDVV